MVTFSFEYNLQLLNVVIFKIGSEAKGLNRFFFFKKSKLRTMKTKPSTELAEEKKY